MIVLYQAEQKMREPPSEHIVIDSKSEHIVIGSESDDGNQL